MIHLLDTSTAICVDLLSGRASASIRLGMEMEWREQHDDADISLSQLAFSRRCHCLKRRSRPACIDRDAGGALLFRRCVARRVSSDAASVFLMRIKDGSVRSPI